MDLLPKEIEDIIIDYKYQLETHEKYDNLKQQFKDTIELEYHSIGNRVMRLTRFNSYEKKYSTHCSYCGNYGEIAEAIYSQNDKQITHKKCKFDRSNKFVYYHRITSKFYDELPDKKFCYCIDDINNIRNILL